ncbi:carbon-nitrogen hydrolase family protein [Corynebacterium ulceribovis]|uniref:carbon-nitrogen hydrolase family protein n=1 Tax=Corynebacterium ulceribovis TaxID=487732 RepID=UPI000477D432|nr:carbon-nitrogen hydrolase family protein [Corynebacterium ulceribovis]
MRISVEQMSAVPDKQANLQEITERIARAGVSGADLVVFPEAAMYPFGAGRLDTVAEPLDGPFASAVRQAAKDANLTVVLGMFRPADQVKRDGKTINRIYNTLLVAGETNAHYDKIHLYDAFGYRESDTIAPGHQEAVVKIAGVSVGLATCFDVRFPEQFVSLAFAGAQLIALPTSWNDGPGKLEQWRTVTAARALDSTCVLVSAGQARPGGAANAGPSEGPTGIGHSVVIGPDGHRLGEAGYDPASLLIDVDVDSYVTRIRKEIPVLAIRERNIT